MSEVAGTAVLTEEAVRPAGGRARSAAPVAEGPSLRMLAARGTAWTVAGFGLGYVLKLASSVVLTHMLAPGDYALAGMVMAFLMALQLLSDIGVLPSIVQHRRGGEAAFLNTAWTLSVVRGVALWGVSAAVAAPYAAWMRQPALVWLVPAGALTAVLDGLVSTKRYTQNRKIEIGRVAVIELISQAVALAVAVAWARWVDRSASALVAMWVTGAMMKTAASHAALPGVNNRFAWDREAARSLVRFGKWVFLSTVLTFLVGQADKIAFARMTNGDAARLAQFGVYMIAAQLAILPLTVLTNLCWQVVFPLYSRVEREGGGLPGVFRRVRRSLLQGAGWVLSGLIAGGPTIVAILFPGRFQAAGWMLRALAIGGWFAALEMSYGMGMLARGRPQLVAASGAGKLAGMLVLMPLGYVLDGFEGAVWGFAASEVLRYAVSVIGAGWVGVRAWRQDLAMTLVVAVASVLGWAGAEATASAGVWVQALAVFAGVSAVWAAAGREELACGASALRARLGRDNPGAHA